MFHTAVSGVEASFDHYLSLLSRCCWTVLLQLVFVDAYGVCWVCAAPYGRPGDPSFFDGSVNSLFNLIGFIQTVMSQRSVECAEMHLYAYDN